MMKDAAIMLSTRLNFLATKLVVAFLYANFLSADLGPFSLLENADGFADSFAGVRAGESAGGRFAAGR